MSLLMLALEYLLLHTVFETIRNNDEKQLQLKDENKKLNEQYLSTWNPLSESEWDSIRNLNGG